MIEFTDQHLAIIVLACVHQLLLQTPTVQRSGYHCGFDELWTGANHCDTLLVLITTLATQSAAGSTDLTPRCSLWRR